MDRESKISHEILSAGIHVLEAASRLLHTRTHKSTKELVQLRDIDSFIDRLKILAANPDPLWGLVSGLDLGLLETIETDRLMGNEHTAALARLRRLIERRPLGGPNSQTLL